MLLKEISKEGYSRVQMITRLDDETIKSARANYARFRLKGVIHGGVYDDDTWYLSDDLRNSTISFGIDEAAYSKGAVRWTECTYECYRDSVKAYIALNLGTYARSTLMIVMNLFRKAAAMDYEMMMELDEDEKSHILNFLKLLPGGGVIRDSVIDDLEEFSYSKNYSDMRTLADFKYYLRFDKAIREYWGNCSEKDKIFYFPIYMWWDVTSILPLRVTEFLLTPYNCLEKDGEKYYLTIRRTKLKKGRRKLAYKVAYDYELCRYEIPERLYREISWYQHIDVEDTDYAKPALGTLFLTSNHVRSADYLTYGHARERLRSLCGEIMGDTNYPVHLGDTRHLAMINLILSGGSPVICRELAGHENISASAHYYGNLSGIVESIVYEKYHEWGLDTKFEGSQKNWVKLPEDSIRVTDGWCDSQCMRAGEIDDCIKDFDGSSALGECHNCRHFYPDNPGLLLRISTERKKAVDRDGEYLMQMIELVRRGLGYQEDIASAMLKLHADAGTYSELLKRKYRGGID